MNDIDRQFLIFQHEHALRLKRAEMHRLVTEAFPRRYFARRWTHLLTLFFTL